MRGSYKMDWTWVLRTRKIVQQQSRQINIYLIIKNAVINVLRSVRFISSRADGSTDKSVIEQETAMSCYMLKSNKCHSNGKPS